MSDIHSSQTEPRSDAGQTSELTHGMDPIASPCTGVCQLDRNTKWCVGCGRTLPEIAAWVDADAEERARVWQTLPARLAMLSGNIAE